MSAGPAFTEASVPRLRRGVRLRFDQRRQAWVLLAPERVLLPDETAVAVLQRCDGNASVGVIVDDLCRAYDAERALIAQDVRALLQDLAEKGVIGT